MTERVDLKVGFRCNNLCKFCVQGGKREKLASKPFAELEKSLKRGLKTGATGVVVTGGEPTLHPRILDVIRLARRLGYAHVQVQSNGRTFCYEKFCRELIAAGATEFSPSLHGSRAELHDALTGAPGSFRQTVVGIRNLKRLGQCVITNSVITAENMRDLPELARLLVSLGVDQYQLAFMHILGRAALHRKTLVARKSEAAPSVMAALDVGRRAGVRAMTEAIPYCLLPGYEDCVAERVIPNTIVFDAEAVIEEYTRHRRTEGKTKGPRCPACRWFAVCEGPWREYPEQFGWDEFVPVPP